MIRRSTNELSIKPKMARRTKIKIYLACLIGLSSAIYGAYWFGMVSAGYQQTKDRSKAQALQAEVKDLNAQLKKTQEDLIYAERQKQIQEEAYNQISLAYANSEQKNQVLGSTLDFYRSIISPEDQQSGPAIQALDHTLRNGRVGFNITLVQAIKHKQQIRGQLIVQAYIDDEMIGQWPNSVGRSVSYQYFTRVSGAIDAAQILGEPQQNLRLLVTLKRPDADSLTRWFDLRDAVSE